MVSLRDLLLLFGLYVYCFFFLNLTDTSAFGSNAVWGGLIHGLEERGETCKRASLHLGKKTENPKDKWREIDPSILVR